jgi:hypothetical protein
MTSTDQMNFPVPLRRVQGWNLSASILHPDQQSFHRLSWSFLGFDIAAALSTTRLRPRLSAKHQSTLNGLRSGPEIVLFLGRRRTSDHRQTALTPFLAERLSASPLAVLERLPGATQIPPSARCRGRTFPIPLPLLQMK